MMRAVYLSLCLAAAVSAAEKPAVVELFEDDANTLIPQLANNGEIDSGGGKIEAIKTDVFAGKVSLRVAPIQRFSPKLKGWDFPIVQKPGPGEYRLVRFAWKKSANTSVMIQFCSQDIDWGHRYFSGPNPPDWPAKQLSSESPREWVVVTRDLHQDFGTFNLKGIAFSPMAWGGWALFDHVVLGRTLEDLDRHTLAILKDTPLPPKLTAGQLEEHWNNLGKRDDTNAIWQLTAHRDQAVGLVEQKLAGWKPDARPAWDAAKARQLIEEAGHHRFVVRESASQELMKLGDGALPLLREAINRAEGESKVRLQLVLKNWSGAAANDRLRLERCRMALTAADTPEAKALLVRVNILLEDLSGKKP
ncbi:hypothetical protein [Zavarzinella formosa]|uniref:hypothetical protein n=1 Tax=Zavarzinella formosa TaxID=360055 RepID=UPI00031F7159|nr:hypothetical protein [Zavarzinella formosa]